MPVTVDLSTDYLAFDGMEAVTVTNPGVRSVDAHGIASETGTTSAVVTNALRRARVDDPERAGRQRLSIYGGEISVKETFWELPVVELPFEPIEGCVIEQADGQKWEGLRVNLATLKTRWRVHCRQLV